MAYRADHLLTLAWHAEKKKKLVIMFSTTCSAAMTVLTPHSQKPPVSKPAIVDCYNHFMNGVDIADQHSVYYRFIRKTVKWWKKIAFWLIEMSMVNSYILYKLTVASPKSPAAYRRSVMEWSPLHHDILVCHRLVLVWAVHANRNTQMVTHLKGLTDGSTDIRKQRSGTLSLLAQADCKPYSPSALTPENYTFLESHYKINSA